MRGSTRRRRERDGRGFAIGKAVVAIVAGGGVATIASGAGGGGGGPEQSPWRRIANISNEVPGGGQTFSSFNQPSVNRQGVVVFRARTTGPGEPIRGIYLRRMQAENAPIETVVERGDEVPGPNNTQTPPGSGELASFLEFPSFPRIDAVLEILATRGQHEPVWTYVEEGGKETRVGTAGVYVRRAGVLETGASLLGAVVDAKTGMPVFPEYSVPGMPEGTRFDQFPGSPSVDGETVCFKGNFTDPADQVGKTGVFYRELGGGPASATHRVASSDTLIPGQPDGKAIRFGSTAGPSAAEGELVFLGLDDEGDPTMGGVYLADIAPDPPLTALAEIGGAVPGELEATFTRLGEALSFDGRYVSFWGAWGEETRTEILECPTDGNPALLAYCNEQHPDGFVVEIPVAQGVFVHDLATGETVPVATTTDEPAGFTDFLYWVYSGRVPGAGGGDEESEELARWRSSAFTAVTSMECGTPGVKGDGQQSCFEAAFKGARGEVDGVYLFRRGGSDVGDAGGLIGALTTQMPGTLLDPEAPVGSTIVTLGIEREALRESWFVVAGSMVDETSKESWAGVYIASLSDIVPCKGDLNGDALVDGVDLSSVLAAWGACGETCPADLDGSGTVDGADVSILLGLWGTCW